MIRVRNLFLSPAKAKCQNDAQMTHLACDWQLELDCSNQELCLWARKFCKITMTSSRCNLHFLTPALLLTFDWQPPHPHPPLGRWCPQHHNPWLHSTKSHSFSTNQLESSVSVNSQSVCVLVNQKVLCFLILIEGRWDNKLFWCKTIVYLGF